MTCDILDDAAHIPLGTLRAPSLHQLDFFGINFFIYKAQPCRMVQSLRQRRRRSTSTLSPLPAFLRKNKGNIRRRQVTSRMLSPCEATPIRKLMNFLPQPIVPCTSVLVQIHCLLYPSSKFDQSYRSGRFIEHDRR